MFEIIFLIISLILSLCVSNSIGMLDSFGECYMPILLWLVFYVLIYISTIIILYLTSLCLKKGEPNKPNKISYFIVKKAVATMCRTARIKVHITGGELIEKGKKYVLVSNHRSNFDPMIQLYKFSRCSPIMISKPENLKIPIAGPYINRSGFLAINREDNREALKTIIKSIQFIKNYNISIGICPEGTRNKKGRDLLPFRVGALKIATKSKVPIVVMTFEGTESIHKNFPLKRSHVYLDVLKVYYPQDFENLTTQELGDEIAKIMQENIDLYSKGLKYAKK